MKRICNKGILFVILSILLIGCNSRKIETNEEVNIESNVESEKTEILGSLRHGLTGYYVDDNTGESFTFYTGGEMCLEYNMCATGMKTQGVGYMVFIDGVPQLYRTNENEEYEYMHIFHLEDNIEKNTFFYLVPSVGKEGDELELCITSVYYPDYIPDMEESKGYGIYHHMVESIYLLKYKETPLENFEQNSKIFITDINQEEIVERENCAEENVKYKFLIDNKDVTLGNYYLIENKKDLNIRLEVMGPDQAEYVCTFYVNHIPCKSDELIHIETKSNKKVSLEANIDISELKGFDTIYVVLVPRNALKMTDINIGLEKTNSILLVRNLIEDFAINNREIGDLQKEDLETEELSLGMFTGYIKYAKDDKLMLLGDDIRIVDVKDLQIVNETNSAEIGYSFHDFFDCDLITLKDGYIVVGNRYDKLEAEKYLTMIKYDEELQFQEVVNVRKLIGLEHEILTYKLFDNGNKLLFSTINGLYVYDFNTTETEILCENGIVVNDCDILIGFNEVFITGELDKGNSTFDRVFGKIDRDIKDIIINEEEYLWGNLWCFENHILIEEADVYGKQNTSMVFCYKPTDGIQAYPLSDEAENIHIFPSDKGNYYATKTKLEDVGYVIRVYSSKDGELIHEMSMTYDEYGTNIKISDVLICENSEKIILVVNSWENQDNEAWIISVEL